MIRKQSKASILVVIVLLFSHSMYPINWKLPVTLLTTSLAYKWLTDQYRKDKEDWLKKTYPGLTFIPQGHVQEQFCRSIFKKFGVSNEIDLIAYYEGSSDAALATEKTWMYIFRLPLWEATGRILILDQDNFVKRTEAEQKFIVGHEAAHILYKRHPLVGAGCTLSSTGKKSHEEELWCDRKSCSVLGYEGGLSWAAAQALQEIDLLEQLATLSKKHGMNFRKACFPLLLSEVCNPIGALSANEKHPSNIERWVALHDNAFKYEGYAQNPSMTVKDRSSAS